MRGLRHALKSIVPNWLAERPSLRTGFTVLYTWALIADCLVQGLLEGIRAAWPGAGDPSALYLIGQSRGLLQGANESNDSYASKLRAWLTTWTNAGSPATMVKVIQDYLGTFGGNPPLVVITTDRAGQWTQVDASGVVTHGVDTGWNWDETDIPSRTSWWSDFWVVIYVVDNRYATYASTTDAAYLAAWGKYGPNTVGMGFTIPSHVISDLATIISAFKGAHSFLQAVIFTVDTAFAPGNWIVGQNGEQENFSRGNPFQAIPNTQDPARTQVRLGQYYRYWIPNNGG